MRIIRQEWRLGKSGRLIRVIRRPRALPLRIKTNRYLIGKERENFEIVQILKKKRIQNENERKKLMETELNKRSAKFKSSYETSEYKAYCSSCRKMKTIKEISFRVIATHKNAFILAVRGDCVHCEHISNIRFLRKATDEEIKAYGTK